MNNRMNELPIIVGIFALFATIVAGKMVLSGMLSVYWFLGGILLALGFWTDEKESTVMDKSDYKLLFKAPDETDWEAEAAISAIEDSWDDYDKMWESKVNCNKCKNEVYLHVCMCKPVVND